jgi:inosose dehydratase
VIDTGHARLGGIDPVAVIREHPARVAHVHAKDVRPGVAAATIGQGASFLDGVLAGMFTVPGDGAIDFAPVCAALRAISYAGWIVIEAEQDRRWRRLPPMPAPGWRI